MLINLLGRVMSRTVRAGAQLLDERYPKWHDGSNINLDTLDISDPSACVCGQLFSTYRHGLNLLRISVWDAWRYGFQGVGPQFMAPITFRLLTYAWKREILVRRVYDMEVALAYLKMDTSVGV